jgi:hypothetical protein
MVLILPIIAFREAIIKTSKIHNLFRQYPNNTRTPWPKKEALDLSKR